MAKYDEDWYADLAAEQFEFHSFEAYAQRHALAASQSEVRQDFLPLKPNGTESFIGAGWAYIPTDGFTKINIARMQWLTFAVNSVVGNTSIDAKHWNQHLLRIGDMWWRRSGDSWLRLYFGKDDVKGMLLEAFRLSPKIEITNKDGERIAHYGDGALPEDTLLNKALKMAGELARPPAMKHNRLPEDRTERAFNLLTGEEEYGIAFSNANVFLSASAVRFAPPRADRFFPMMKPYGWTSTPKPTPAWEKLLLGIANGNRTIQHYIELLVGSVAAGDNTHQRLWALIGQRRSGKSTLMQVLRAAAGENAWMEISLMSISETFDAPEIVSKSLLVLDEVGESPSGGRALTLWKTGWRYLKRLVGNDPLAGRDMYSSKRRPFIAHCNVVITDNDAPAITSLPGDAEAWYDRLIPIPFTQTFAEGTRTKNLGDFIVNEEIVDVVSGCLAKWSASEERRTGKFVLDDAMESLRLEMLHSPLACLDEFVVADPTSVFFVPEMRVLVKALWERSPRDNAEYKSWVLQVCKALGVSSKTKGTQRFRGAVTRFYMGIRWADDQIKEELYQQMEL